jgi:hypothetical protein
MARLHPQALGTLFVASDDLQDYGGGIRPRLHTGLNSFLSHIATALLITSRHGPHIKHRFHCYSPTMPRTLHSNGCCSRSHRLATAYTPQYIHTLDPDIGYFEDSRSFPQSFQASIAIVFNLFNTLLTNHPATRRYIVPATNNAVNNTGKGVLHNVAHKIVNGIL